MLWVHQCLSKRLFRAQVQECPFPFLLLTIVYYTIEWLVMALLQVADGSYLLTSILLCRVKSCRHLAMNIFMQMKMEQTIISQKLTQLKKKSQLTIMQKVGVMKMVLATQSQKLQTIQSLMSEMVRKYILIYLRMAVKFCQRKMITTTPFRIHTLMVI